MNKGKPLSWCKLFSRIAHQLLLSVLFLLSTVLGAYAQVSPLTSSGLNTQISRPVALSNGGVKHTITGGTRPGNGVNLFHSFGELNIPEDHIASFLNDSGLPTSNILSRVTGGNPSNIFGTIQTEGFGDANLFLLNPAGIVFGLDATLNVGGDAHFTTADYLRFEDGGQFTALPTEQEAVLSSVPVAAFGFLDASVTPVSLQDSILSVAEGRALSLVGGDISIGSGLQALGGQIGLASVASSGEVLAGSFDASSNVNGESFVDMGEITLSDSAILDTSGPSGGTVLIRGGQLIVEASTIFAHTKGPLGNSPPELPGQGIDIILSGDLQLDNGAKLATNVLPDAAPDIGSGGIRVQAEKIEIREQSIIESNVLFGSAGGNSGDIQINANSILVQSENFDNGAFQTGTSSMGDSGNILIQVTKDLEVREGSFLWTFTTGAGKAGDIEVGADRLILSSSRSRLPDFTGISSQSFGSPETGNVGNIRVVANSLDITNAEISTPSFTSGNAGDIELVLTGDLNISGAISGVQSNTFDVGQGGRVDIQASDVSVSNQGSIEAGTFGSGNGGGALILLSGDLTVKDRAFIQVRSGEEATGGPGDLIIKAEDILVSGFSEAVKFEISPEFTGISASTFEGVVRRDEANEPIVTGNIQIEAKNLVVKDKGFINTATFGSPTSGDLSLELEGDLSIENGGQIFALTRGAGDAGNISIQARDLELSGVNPTPSETLDGQVIAVASKITTESQGNNNGAGGNINVVSRELRIVNGASITSKSVSSANAGNIQLTATDKILLDGGSITTESVEASGGNIKLDAGNVIQVTDSKVTSRVQEGSGAAGSINIDPEFIVIENSEINSSAQIGNGGDVTFVASSAILFDSFSNIDTSSQFGGNGTVDIQAPIRNLSGTIAPLPEDVTPVTALYSARCAAGQQGHFNTFVDSKVDSLSPTPGRFLPSPLLRPLNQVMVKSSVNPKIPVLLTASIAPLVFGHVDKSTTACQ